VSFCGRIPFRRLPKVCQYLLKAVGGMSPFSFPGGIPFVNDDKQGDTNMGDHSLFPSASGISWRHHSIPYGRKPQAIVPAIEFHFEPSAVYDSHSFLLHRYITQREEF